MVLDMSQNSKIPSNTISWGPILTLVGVIITAYFGYLTIRYQIEYPITVTQTAEARLTLIAQTQPSPTSTNQEFPNLIATATSTPQPTGRIGGILSVRKQTSSEIRDGLPTSIWSNIPNSGNGSLEPGVNVYFSEIQKSKEYLLPIFWCATTLEILNENMASINTQFYVNNEQVPSEYIRSYNYDSNDDWKCNLQTVVYKEWDENAQYTLEVRRTFSQQIFDGKSFFPEGTYIDKIVLDVR
jgi:hypothetical protein